MNSLEYVAYLNNEGIWLLQQDDPFSAIQAFRRASALLRDVTLPQKYESPGYEAALIATCRALCIRQSQAPLPLHPASKYHLYNRPFRIEPFGDHLQNLDKRITSSTRDDFYSFLNLMNVHMLFNAALAWQHYAAKFGTDDALLQSGRLYKVLLEAVRLRVYDRNHEAYEALSCLVFNNLAVLHYELCQYAECEVCLSLVQSLLADLNGLEAYLHPDELTGVLWNTINREPPTVAGAA